MYCLLCFYFLAGSGFVIHDENDDYTIILNDRLGPEVNRKTLGHELEHIKRRDIYANEAANYIEMERHRL